MLQLTAFLFVSAFIALVVLGHVLLLVAFYRIDCDGRRTGGRPATADGKSPLFGLSS